MEKVYVNVDYQVLVGGAIKPVRIYWHDGRAFNIRKDNLFYFVLLLVSS